MRRHPTGAVLALALMLAGCSSGDGRGAAQAAPPGNEDPAAMTDGPVPLEAGPTSAGDAPWFTPPPPSAPAATESLAGGIPIRIHPLPPAPSRPLTVRDLKPELAALAGEPADIVNGKRPAALVSMRLSGGEGSLEALARTFIASAAARDFNALMRLHVSADEFRWIVWPELPQSSPRSHIDPALAWRMHLFQSRDAANSAIEALEGRRWVLRRIEVARGRDPYRNFAVYRGVRLIAADSTGAERTVDFAHTVIERQGSFKVYIYKN